jgi:hypothetical protein
MITPVTVILSFALLLLVLALFRPQAGRIVFGVFFLLMAWGVNFPMVLSNPSLYVAAGEHALIPFYRWFFTHVLVLNPPLFVAGLIAFETGVGLLVLGNGRQARGGLPLGALFCLGIAWIGVEGVMMPAVALAPLLLARRDFPASLVELAAAHLPGRRQAQGLKG